MLATVAGIVFASIVGTGSWAVVQSLQTTRDMARDNARAYGQITSNVNSNSQRIDLRPTTETVSLMLARRDDRINAIEGRVLDLRDQFRRFNHGQDAIWHPPEPWPRTPGEMIVRLALFNKHSLDSSLRMSGPRGL